MKKYLLLILSFFCWSLTSIAQYEGDQIFDQSYLHEIQITTDLTLDELFDIYADELFTGSYSYNISEILIDGNSLDSVGVRVKGGISGFDDKRPLKLDFNAFVGGRKYDGLKKLNLHQGNMDPSFMRETLAYGLMRNAGLKTVRTSYAKVFVNGTYEGIYTLIEQIDDDFIHRQFASADGALYKTGFDGLDVKYENDNSFTYAEFETAVNQIPIEQLDEQLSDYLDVESFLRFFCLEVFLNAADGPLTSDGNYYIYYEPKSATYVYVPWDYNLSLYGGLNHTLLQSGNNFIFEKIKQNSVLRERYLRIFCELLQYNFTENRLLGLVDTYRNLLADEVPNDPYIQQIGDFNTAVSSLENILSARVQSLTAEMNMSFNPCQPLENPLSFLDISINEIVASNDSTSGIFDPAGGAADWIELYNNTSESISLNGFYLSNDADFLKHWKFPAGLIIPANDYLIIWADRDIDEPGLHSDFKLNKSRGDLYLSFENGEIIDSLNYENQNTNIGLARVPNGTGPFMMQPTTFGATNDMVTAIQNQPTLTEFSIFPNPTQNNIHVKIHSSNTSSNLIQVVNLQGQIIWEKELTILSGNNLITIPTNQMNPGMYFLNLTNRETLEKKMQPLVILD